MSSLLQMNGGALAGNRIIDSKVNYERVYFESLVNEGKSQLIGMPAQSLYIFNEKKLKEEAAAEVAQKVHAGQFIEEEEDEEEEIADSESKKRKGVNSEDKLLQSKNRNKEHARNTRLRKKLYIEKLKKYVDEMTSIQHQLTEKRQSLGRVIYEEHIKKQSQAQLFLNYLSAKLLDSKVWNNVIDQNFIFQCPIMNYRFSQCGDVENNYRVIKGIQSFLLEILYTSLMLRKIGKGTYEWFQYMLRNNTTPSRLIYDVKSMVCAHDTLYLTYSMQTENPYPEIPSTYCIQSGMMQFRFNAENKITCVISTFDTSSFSQQLMSAMNVLDYCEVSLANTPEKFVVPCIEGRICFDNNSGNNLISSENESFVKLMSKHSSSSSYLGCGILQLPIFQSLSLQDGSKVIETFRRHLASCSSGIPFSTVILFLQTAIYVNVYPLKISSSGKFEQCLATFEELVLPQQLVSIDSALI